MTNGMPPDAQRTPLPHDEVMRRLRAGLAKYKASHPPKPKKPDIHVHLKDELTPEQMKALRRIHFQHVHDNFIKGRTKVAKPKLSTVALHDLRAKLALNMVAKRTRLTPKPVAPLRPALFAPAHETAHSPYTFRWQHRTSLKFRVWPVGERTRRDIATIKELPITGFEMNSADKLEAWHKIWGRGGHRFELSDEDAELLALAGGAGVRILTDRMVLHAPGSLDEKVKKEYWLEIPVSIYPASPCRSNGPCKRPRLRNVFGPTAEKALDANGIKRSKVVFVESMNDVDEEVLAREVVENDAVVVFLRDDVPAPVRNGLVERSAYWVVPGRRPDEDGGAFRGYQFHDRLFRWIPRYGGEDARRRAKERLDRAHATVREKGALRA